jgi:hypothetical protein
VARDRGEQHPQIACGGGVVASRAVCETVFHAPQHQDRIRAQGVRGGVGAGRADSVDEDVGREIRGDRLHQLEEVADRDAPPDELVERAVGVVRLVHRERRAIDDRRKGVMHQQ